MLAALSEEDEGHDIDRTFLGDGRVVLATRQEETWRRAIQWCEERGITYETDADAHVADLWHLTLR